MLIAYELQSSINIFLAADTGFEPVHDGVRVRSLTAWLICYAHILY